MKRHVTEDLYQIGESVAGIDGWREAVRVYVLANEGCPLVFDTGSHLHTGQIMPDLKNVLGGVAPEFAFLTHTELPHTGNLRTITETWPDIKLVVSSAILPHVELPWWISKDQVQFAYAGTDETYGGRRISFLDGILKDQPGTHWMYDPQTETLFTADAFGYLFPEPADLKFDDEIDGGIPLEWLKRYHESVFRFLPMVRGANVTADIKKVLGAKPIKTLAPTHGNAVRGDIPQFVNRFSQAILEICA